MVGGMLGTALVGTLVTHVYVARVPKAVESSIGNVSDALLGQLKDPQLLVERNVGESVLRHLGHITEHGSLLMSVLRHVFTSSIHLGFVLTALAAFIGVFQVRRISHMRFHPAETEAVGSLD
jgi:hypothetical protein